MTLQRINAVAVLLAAASTAVAGVASAADESRMLQGTVAVASNAALAASDRLVVKIYHPGEDGLELDPKYWIFEAPALPMQVSLAPTAEMSGNARYRDYVVEAFSDRDGDVLSVVDGELWAATDGPRPLGTTDFLLELAPRH